MCIFTSCTTTRSPIRIPTPTPLDENGESVVTYEKETDTVKMPFWYWEQLMNYIFATQALMAQ